jgi:glycosyltransferase involved in cell wall biosynthesis
MTYGDAAYCANFRKAGIKVTDWHPDKKFDKAAVSRIRTALIEGGYNILQMYNSRAYWSGIQAAKGLYVKVVLYRGYQGNLQWYQPGLYLRYFNSRVDKIICNSIGVEEEFRKANPFISWDKKLITINKGHRQEWYAGVQPADLAPFGVKPGSFVLTCIANARRMKGVVYLMRAIQLLPKGLDLYLLMVGKGLETPRFRKMADQSAYAERIVFTGFQSNPLEIDKASDVYVLASIYGESITKGAIEAMSVGTAPLITNIPGNRYLVEDGVSGVMVPPKNPEALASAIVSLYENRKLCRELGINAQERIASHLHTDTTVEEMEKFYKDLAAGGNTYRNLPDVL